MKRIAITSEIDKWAQEFLKDMLYKVRHVEVARACKNLEELISNINAGWLVPLEVMDNVGNLLYARRNPVDLIAYIRKMKEEYKMLLIMHPFKFIDKIHEFESLIGTDEISRIEFNQMQDANGLINPPKKKLFHELLVQAMRYNHVQSKVFSKYIRLLGIKTCVYCNSQYAITTRSGESLYQLDHCLPKSKYPYLCTSFFNLQPCCGSCNLRKSANDMLYGKCFATIWREENEPDIDYFSFSLKANALSYYLLSHETDDLEIELVVEDDTSEELKLLHRDYQNYFKIDALYAENKDVVEEVVWKKYVYSDAYRESLHSAFKAWIKKDDLDVERLMMGNYMNKNEVYKRPLSKLVQDIAKQLHIDLEQTYSNRINNED